MYLFYFPEITLNPNIGQAGSKVAINATDFPDGANVTRLRFANTDLPVPAGTAADANGDFNLVLNVPKTIWGGANITSGWYDVEVQAQKSGEPPVFIKKPFQVTASDVAFTIKAEPNWLPPIPPTGSTTTIRINSLGAAANVTLSVDRIPPGISTAFSTSLVNVPPGGSGTATLTLTPTSIQQGHYGAEIKGTATIGGSPKTFYAHLEFDVQPPMEFMDTSWMAQQGVWFPDITINPNAGPVKTKVSLKATGFPAGAEITNLRFAGRELPVPANTLANDGGDVTLVFNVPGDFGMGQYMVEVEATKTGMPPVFIAKPFFIEDSGVSFRLDVVPGFIPGVEQGQSGNTTVFVESNGPSVTVNLNVDGLPPGITANFSSLSLTVPPGGSVSTQLTVTTRASTPPGHYPLTVRGVSGAEVRMTPFGFGVIPPAAFQMPEFTLEPDFASAGYYDKTYKVTFSGTGFPASKSVTSLTFGALSVAIPDNLSTDTNGNFNGVFQMPTGLTPGTYDVRVAVADGSGGYIYDSRPFAVRGAEAKFILNTSPPYLPPVLQGGQGVTMVNVRSVGTTAANVTLSVDGLAPGITAEFTPSNIVTVSPGGSGSATLTLTVGANTPTGPYPLNIRGGIGSQTVVIPLGFGVMPDIGGGEGHATVTINPAQARPGEHIGISGAGFTGGRTITLTAAPPGAPVPIDITPGAIQVQNDGTWATEITVPEAGQVPSGTYIIKASDGTMASKNHFSIVPATSADFFLNVSPQFLQVGQGQSGNTTISLSSKNGFKDNVTFSVGHLAPGVTATFKNAAGTTVGQFTGAPGGIREIVTPVELTPVPGEDLIITMLIDVDAATPIGPYDIGLEVGSATVFRSIPLGLMVTSPGASLAVSPMSGPADTDIRLSGSGFTPGETLTVKFAGSAITTVPAAVTATQDGTFTATITAPSTTAGIYPISVTGGTSGISIDRPFSLKPSAGNSFVLYASPAKVDIPRGGANTITTRIEPVGSFQSAVALSVSGLSAVSGATASFLPSATITPSIGTPTTATLTISVPAGATAGRYPITLTGTSGAITQTRKLTLNVVPPAGTADFGISLAPNTVPVSPNASGNTTVTVSAVNGFTGTLTLTAGMLDPLAPWPAGITATTGNVTPSATTGLGKKPVVFTVAAGTLPGSWAIKITGTSGALSHSTDVMVVVTPSGTTITPYASPRLDPTTITASTPMGMDPPWGDKITINGIINDGAEASVITPSKVDVTPETLANLPEGASDILGRVTNIESSAPVDGVEWDLGFPYDPAVLAAAGMSEENLKVAYLNPSTGAWTEVTTTVDTTNKIAYASPDHFSSWTLLATPTPPPSEVVTQYPAGGGGGGGASGVTSLHEFITGSGRFVIDSTAESDDHRVELAIPKDTVARNKVGQPFYTITIREQAAPAAAPAGSRILGLVYDVGPGGATFDPPVNLVFNYADSWIPSGVAEESLVIATWQDGGWVELDNGTVDTAANTITAPVSHFTVFTILAHTTAAGFEMASLDVSPTTVNPGETVTVRATVSNTGDIAGSHKVTIKLGDEVIAVEQIDLAGGASRTLTFTLAAPDAGSYTVDVNGLRATLTVIEIPEEPTEEAVVAEEPTAPEEAAPAAPEAAPAPEETPAAPPETLPATPEVPEVAAVPPTETAPTSRMNDLFIFLGVVAAGAVIIGIVYWRTRLVRKKS
ncbi:MAG: CARDB domain-containing protein [Chloroflexota bacterium]